MYGIAVCQNDYGNTGKQKYCGPVGKVRTVVFVPSSASIATKTLALTESTWLTNLNAEKSARWFPIERVVEGEPTQNELVIQEFDYGDVQFIRNGEKSVVYTLDRRSTYNKNELNKLNGTDWKAYLITELNNILGWTDDMEAGVFYPYTCNIARVLPETELSGSEGENIQIRLDYADIEEFNGKQVVLNPVSDSDAPAVWYPQTVVKGLKDLVVAVSGISATGATVNLQGYGGTPYNLAVKEDINFYLASASGTPIALTTLTPSGSNDGNYTAVWPSQTPDTYGLGLFDQPDATTQGVESPVDAAVVIT